MMDTIVKPSSLSEINEILGNAGLPKFSADGLTSAVNARGREKLMQAFVDLQKGTPHVDMFLQNLVLEHGVDMNSVASPADANTGAGQGAKQQTPPAPPKQPTNQPAPANQGRAASHPSGANTAPNSGAAIPNSQMPPEMQNQGQFDKQQVKVYGKKAALCVEEDVTKAGYKTVAIEGALSNQGSNREYDWKNKTRIQVTKSELPMFAAILLGMVNEIEYKNHGPENNKGFSFQNQGDKYFARVFSPEGVKALPVSPDDAYHVCNLVLAQLTKNYPGLSAIDQMASLRQMVAMKTAAPRGN